MTGNSRPSRSGKPVTDLFAKVDTATLDRTSGRSAVVILVARLANLIITLLAQSVLGRLIMPADYGIYAMGMTVLSFLLIFREFGLQTAGMQKQELSREDASFLFWANLLIILTLGALGAIAAPAAAKFYDSETVTPVIMAMIFAAIVGGLSAQHSMLLRRQYKFNVIATIDIFALICGVVVGVTVGWWRHDVWALVAMSMVQQIIVTVLTFATARWVPGSIRWEESSSSLLGFGAGVTAANVLYYVSNNIGAIIIGRYLGEAPLGHYNRAQQIYAIPSTVMFSSVYTVVFGSLSRLNGDADGYRAFYVATLRRVSLFYMMLSGILIFAGDDVIRVLLGPNWQTAGEMLKIFSIALVGSGMAQTSGMLYQSQARIREFQVWSVIDCSIRVAAILIGSFWGIYGFAFGFAISTTFITAPTSLWFVGRRGPVSFRDQIVAIAPSAIVFLLALGGAGAGHWLTRGLDAGIIPLLAECGGGAMAVIAIGSVLPTTRKTLIEIIVTLRALK
ncbi:lipopolysaccharide biosynthesis protein [Rhizobium sp. AQ_MP]|uniref:lipopolysaccharide biosynthesis protein n=1 Tax=Rhizobium sp. AQ_MP TaxID=2761536 RepID=UPI001639C0C8|nr:lipopolysaccharide biosynthesis protein [Rhizobium sp. AQ_MP]MBC2775892.1 lipopolysaccharide biosynthesis protein [Rhizobium sp. AQ_MP]